MRRIFPFLLISLLAMALSGNAQTQAPVSSGPVDTVNAFLAALGNADLNGILTTFSNDATVFLPIGAAPKRLTGRKEIGEGFAPFLDGIRSSGDKPPYLMLKPQNLQVQDFGDTAIVTFHLGKLPAEGTQQATSFSRRTLVLHRIKGQWFIVHMHASNMHIEPKRKE